MSCRKQSGPSPSNHSGSNALVPKVDESHLASAAAFKRRALSACTPSPFVPSSWEQAASAIFIALHKALVHVALVAPPGNVDHHKFSTCIPLWGRTYLEIAVRLLEELSRILPSGQLRERVARTIPALSKALVHLSAAEAGRNDPGGSGWHVRQIHNLIASGTMLHIALMEAMMLPIPSAQAEFPTSPSGISATVPRPAPQGQGPSRSASAVRTRGHGLAGSGSKTPSAVASASVR